MNEHLNALKKEKHKNPKMQNVYNASFDDPRFSIVLYCEDEELNYYEEAFIQKHYDDKYNMNIAKDATAPMKGRKLSKESREKMSKAQMGLRKGIPLSEETKKKISEARKGMTLSEETREKVSKAKAKKEIYSWVHDDGIAIECSVRDLWTTQGLDKSALWKMVKGQQKQHKGWRLK